MSDRKHPGSTTQSMTEYSDRTEGADTDATMPGNDDSPVVVPTGVFVFQDVMVVIDTIDPETSFIY